MEAINSRTAERIKAIARYSLGAIVVATILLLSFSNADAKEGNNAKAKMVKKEITKMLHYPVDIMMQMPDGLQEAVEVRIALKVDESGQINVDEVYSGSELLSNYVKDELNDKNIENYVPGSTTDYSFIVQFKTI